MRVSPWSAARVCDQADWATMASRRAARQWAEGETLAPLGGASVRIKQILEKTKQATVDLADNHKLISLKIKLQSTKT
jgi:hypothetical protein